MGDLIFVLVVVVFFTVAALFVRWCDHLIGPDDLPSAGRPARQEPEAEPAPAARVRR